MTVEAPWYERLRTNGVSENAAKTVRATLV